MALATISPTLGLQRMEHRKTSLPRMSHKVSRTWLDIMAYTSSNVSLFGICLPTIHGLISLHLKDCCLVYCGSLTFDHKIITYITRLTTCVSRRVVCQPTWNSTFSTSATCIAFVVYQAFTY